MKNERRDDSLHTIRRGRPARDPSIPKTIRSYITWYPADRDKAAEIGNGNISAGVREALKQFKSRRS
ncbi:MAG TPA: hypothetical protein PK967_12715 [Candidatus Hydrogenedentes bacterium]|nr:hypothetical protein [Candidatus Hydrogenedentota bacterium]